MKFKRVITATLAIAIFWMFLDWLVHANILAGYYMKTAKIWRSGEDMKDLFWMNTSLTALMAFLYTFLFEMFDNKKSDISLGLLIGVISGVAAFGSYYFLPISMVVALVWAFHQLVGGIFAHYIYRMLS